MNKHLAAALAYAERLGFSVIPVGKGKKPLIKWEPYQKHKASPDEIEHWWSKWADANIGIVTGQISNIAVIDIDTLEGKNEIKKFIPEGLIIPTCTTPKGGQHLYFRCPDSKLTNNTRMVTGCDLRANGGYVIAPPSDNGNGKAYAFLEGLSPFEVELPALPEKYLCFIASANKNTNTYIGDVTLLSRMFSEGRRDNDIFHVANCLVKGVMPRHEVEQVLEILAKNCNPPFPLDELQVKIESAIKRAVKREINVTDEVRKWISVTDGDFSVTDCVRECQSVTGVTKRDIYRKIFQRLKEEGYIQKVGKADGHYRRVDDVAEEIDFLSASTDSVRIQWPFQIEKLVKTHPKNIIVIAGTPNAGKTAFLLNTVAMNMDHFKINYFSSEMGPIELKERLSKFSFVDLKDFKKVRWLERSSNFADVIKPDEINIIDFLEITDNYYLIAQNIKDIFDKLTTGIAVIAIQKNPGQSLGLGGGRSNEKARMYLSMDAGRLRIEKGKNWADQTVNPNGLEITFKLVQGCHFTGEDEWHKSPKG